MRRHHNSTGYRQIKNGKTYEQVKRIRERVMSNDRLEEVIANVKASDGFLVKHFCTDETIKAIAEAVRAEFCIPDRMHNYRYYCNLHGYFNNVDEHTTHLPLLNCEQLSKVMECSHCGQPKTGGKG